MAKNNKHRKKKSTFWPNFLGVVSVIFLWFFKSVCKYTFIFGLLLIACLMNDKGFVGVECNIYAWLYEDVGLANTGVDLQPYLTRVKPTLGEEKEYTVMVYMIGADLESSNGAGSDDILEMLQASFNKDTQVLLYTGGSFCWHNNVVSARKNQVYLINESGMQLMTEYDRKNMAEPETLEEFIRYVKTNFPAKHEALIVWDHGDGPVWGYGFADDVKDDNHGEPMMSVNDLCSALDNALGEERLDWFAFDACLMGSLEVLSKMADYTDCVVASPESTDISGFYYTGFLSEIGNNTSISPFEIGTVICDDYAEVVSEAYSDGGFFSYDSSYLLCTYDTRKVAAAVETLNDIAHKIRQDYTTSQLCNTAAVVKGYGNYSFDLIDSGMFASLYLLDYPTEVPAFVQQISDIVYYKTMSDNTGYSSGVSIYFPYSYMSLPFTEDGTFQEYIAIDWGADEYEALVLDAIDYVQESDEYISSFLELFDAGELEAETETESE